MKLLFIICGLAILFSAFQYFFHLRVAALKQPWTYFFRMFIVNVILSILFLILLKIIQTLSLPDWDLLSWKIDSTNLKLSFLSVWIAVFLSTLLFFRSIYPKYKKKFGMANAIVLCFLVSIILEIFVFNFRHFELISTDEKNIDVPLDTVIYLNRPLSETDGIIKNTKTAFAIKENSLVFNPNIADVRNIRIVTGENSKENLAFGITITQEKIDPAVLYFGEQFILPYYDGNPIFRFRNDKPGQEITLYFGNAIYESYLQIKSIILNQEIPFKINFYRICFFALLFYLSYIFLCRKFCLLAGLYLFCKTNWKRILFCIVCIAGIQFLLDRTERPLFFVFLIVSIALLVFNLFILIRQNHTNENILICILFGLGMIVRTIYVLSSPWQVHQHDVIGHHISEGHIGYILNIFTHSALPNSADPWQFIHPPLHHLLGAVYLKILAFLGLLSTEPFEQLQFLTLFYGILILILSLKLLRVLGIKNSSLIYSFSVLCFHPQLIFLSGSLNNDELLLLFTLAGLYCAIRWSEFSSKKYLLFAALFTGLAMVTKTSGVLLLPAILLLIFIKKCLLEKKFPSFLIDSIIFIAVFSLAAGWWVIRCQTVLSIPINSIYYQGEASPQYIGNYSFVQRLFSFDPEHFQSLFVRFDNKQFADFSIPISIIKSSIFGGWEFERKGIAFILIFSNILLILGSIFAMLKKIDTLKEKNLMIPFLYIVYCIQVFSFLFFCFRYPHTCTQDFRYIVITLIIGICFIGLLMKAYVETKNRFKHIIVSAFRITILLFDVCSIFIVM